jgi:hypothetical protein
LLAGSVGEVSGCAARIAHQYVIADGAGGAQALFHIAAFNQLRFAFEPGIAIGLQFHALGGWNRRAAVVAGCALLIFFRWWRVVMQSRKESPPVPLIW